MDIFSLDDEDCQPRTQMVRPHLDFLDDLNPEQRQAVETTQGAVLVLSGAGTGKTRVLTTRIAYLIATAQAQPWEILAVTFTNKASREMKERLEKMIGGNALSVWLGTFHAIGIKILRKYGELVGLNSNFIVLDSDDQERLLKQIMQDDGIDTKKFAPSIVLDIIQRWKDKGLLPHQITQAENVSYCEGRVLRLYQRYQERLQSLNAVDFGDLLLLPLTLFQQNIDVLKIYQKQFHYILVDEYQDTNIAQYMLLRLLAKGHGNICCVGDDDQSIYSWRGAEVENILSFQKVFPEALVIRLERNYRSTGHILGCASELISNNESRLGKTLRTADDSVSMGEKVLVQGYWNGKQEAEKIVSQIDSSRRLGIRLSDMAILVRASFQTRTFEEVLVKTGIPYKIIGGFKFYEREEIKDGIAYLRLVLNTSDDLALLRIINKPRRGIGAQALDSIMKTAQEKKLSLFDAISWAELRPITRKALDSFIAFINQAKERALTLEPKELAEFVLEQSGYLQMWRQDKSTQAQGRIENVLELYNVLGEFENIESFIEYATLVTEVDERSSEDQLVVMTLHASKGLEFKHVYLPGWEEGLFPHQKALDEKGGEGLEEERRLAYVGITRAREKVMISYAGNRLVYGQVQNSLPSRFIEELPQEHIIQKNSQSSYGDFYQIKPAWVHQEDDEEKTYNPFSSNKTPYRSKWDRESLNTQENNWMPQGVQPNFKKRASKRLGKRVYHELFGYGTVIKEEGSRLEVHFDSTGAKKIDARYLEEVAE